MTTLWWSLVVLLMVLGFLGTFVPMLPDSVLILAGAVVHKIAFPEGTHTVSWWTIGVLLVLVVVSYTIEFFSGAVGAKYFGATKYGAIGGLVGAFVGLFFGIPGIFIGPVLGVLAGELIGGKKLVDAGKSTWGTLFGTLAGMVVKVGIALVMIGWFVADIMIG
jgi:uncharacterized protein YqgC (DUF456 family)